MKDFFKKLFRTEIKGIPHEYQWAAFLLPVFLLGTAFLSCKIHPFGETSLLTNDLFHQYAPVLAEIRSKILSGESLFYTWNMGLGTNFWPILSYNGASPLNLILLAFPQANLSDGITLLILLRTGLSGLFFSLLLNKKDGFSGPPALALSTAYALCGYVLAYFWALMWMDAVVLLPLVVLGLWKIFTGEKPRLYVAALFLVIFSNFYFGFFVCLFLVLFAPVLYMEARRKSIFAPRPSMAVLRFAGYSLLAAGMTSILLVPTVAALKFTSAAAEAVSWTPNLSFPIFDFFSRFLVHVDPVIRAGLPNVYCSVSILLLIILYALCRTIPLSQRAGSAALAFFLYLSMSSPVLDFFWHGMHYTNEIPYRQAFLLCFLLLFMASQVLQHVDGLSRKKVFYAGASVLIYLVILDQSAESSKNYWLIYGSAAFVIIYSTVLSGFFSSGKGKKWAQKAFLYAIILEMFLSAEFALAYIEKTEHFTYVDTYGQYADTISKEISVKDNGSFSRTVITPSLTGNDGALYHVKTIPIFASTTSENFVKFMGGLGFANNQQYEVDAAGMTDVSSRLLGIRYTVEFTGGIPAQDIRADNTSASHTAVLNAAAVSAPTADSADMDTLYSGYKITTNEKVLPVGFFMPYEIPLVSLDSRLSPFEQTNSILETLGVQAAYTSGNVTLVSASNIEKSSNSDTYSIMAAGQTASITLTPDVFSGGSTDSSVDRDVLLYLGTSQKPKLRITRTDSSTGKNTVTVTEPLAGQIINCGPAPQNDKETMTVQFIFSSVVSETFPIYCYSIDAKALDNDIQTLGLQPLTVTSVKAGQLTGSVNFTKDGYLFTTIPFDTGWTVKIDGTVVTAKAAYGALLSVPVSKGSHDIAFSYQPSGFIPGLLISLVLTAGFVLLSIWNPISYAARKRVSREESARTDEKEE